MQYKIKSNGTVAILEFDELLEWYSGLALEEAEKISEHINEVLKKVEDKPYVTGASRANTISNAVDGSHFDERKAMYLKRIQKYNKKEQEIFPQLAAETVMALEKNPEQDFLGKIFMELNLSNDSGGQFFTPYTVCKMMAEMTLNDIVSHVKEHGYITINDPACGAGATLIAAIHAAAKPLGKAGLNWQNHVLITAQDIDYTVAMMCYIQLSLLGAAAYIKIGNSLTEPMSSNDTLENYWFTPMYFCEPWSLRRSIKGRVLL